MVDLFMIAPNLKQLKCLEMNKQSLVRLYNEIILSIESKLLIGRSISERNGRGVNMTKIHCMEFSKNK